VLRQQHFALNPIDEVPWEAFAAPLKMAMKMNTGNGF